VPPRAGSGWAAKAGPARSSRPDIIASVIRDGENGLSGDAASARVILRRIARSDQHEYIRLARASAGLHHPWMTLPATPAEFEAYVARFDQPTALGLLVCLRDTGAIAGQININNIVRGNFRCGAIGYAAFAAAAGRGYMSEGLALVLRLAFGELGLHRLEANIQPANEASRQLVRRCGFRLEGYSPAFLFIDGSWKDHERWAITSEMISDLSGPG
jgi:ribosomal-protein-alanine N-acetyltransferase